VDAKLRRLLQELKGAISKTLSESPDVERSMDRIREEGWSVYLVVDRKRDDETPEGIELTADRNLPSMEVVFRIDRQDLAFLRSIGIDPTRRLRRRRSS
jgi:hypothetical protein